MCVTKGFKNRMADETTIHIAIYILNSESNDPREKFKIGYEVEDNDPNLLITPDLFRECLESFAKDQDVIYPIPPDELRHWLAAFEMKAVVPSHIRAKIERIIGYIERNLEIYGGVAVVYQV